MARITDFFRRLRGNAAGSKPRYEQLHATTKVFSNFNGSIYDHDVVRAAVWAIAEACGKVNLRHIRGEGKQMQHDPDLQIRNLLVQANNYMSMQDLIARMVIDREINNNSFVWIVRDSWGKPIALYPLDYNTVRLKEDGKGTLSLLFSFRSAKAMEIPYSDVIHIRKHCNDDFFGANNNAGLHNLMEILNTTDQGMVEAVRQGAQISWILKFATPLTPKDKKAQIELFGESWLSSKNNPWGVVPVDINADAQQVKPNSYVPNSLQMQVATKRLLQYFGISEKIIDGTYTEAEYNSFYESKIEPFLQQVATQMTLKFFSDKERGFHNRIVAESTAMQYASNNTKLALVSMVDRGALTPNEWRAILNLAPVEGGDEPIRRLDTAKVEEEKPESKPEGEEAPSETGQEARNKRMQDKNINQRAFEVRSLELDEAAEDKQYILEGTAIVFDQPTVMFKSNGIEYKEVIASGALDEADMDDVPLKYNHSNHYIAVARHSKKKPNRSTMDFIVDKFGLHIKADVGITHGGRELHRAVEGGIVDKMSFAFTVREHKYDEETHTVTITKIDRLYDVSAVDTPAYNQTSIYARSELWMDIQAKAQAADALAQRKQNTLELIEAALKL